MRRYPVFCSRCGSSVATDARFCPSCGALLAHETSALEQRTFGKTPAKAPVPTRVVLALAALVVMLVALGLIAWRHQVNVAGARQAEIAARQAQAQARLDALTEQFDTLSEEQAHISDLEARYAGLDNAYRAAENDAYSAMRARHYATDDDVITEHAKRELAAVNKMQGMLPDRYSSLEGISDAYATAIGKNAVASFRIDTDQLIQTEGLGLNRWWRAINDITAALTSGSLPTENIEQLYDESSDYDTRASTQAEELERQWTELQKQLQGRIDGVTNKLTMYFPILDQSQRPSAVPDVVTKTWKLDSGSYYPFDAYDSDATFAAAADKAIAKLAPGKNSPWFARFNGVGSPIAFIRDPAIGDTFAFFQICKPHECSTMLYGFYDFSTKNMCTALYDDNTKSATTACNNDNDVSTLDALRIRMGLDGGAGQTSLRSPATNSSQ